ncbi:hypothetical protein ElyMa_001675800 [Elysia marginata]|uniref:Uncharacterized protein n=1 Tax=Elysia marginata TaxID=1093978 RepID=A0AAV4JTX6_9GAST|nr:hypothetical protein ElyMa_001675800 [Elysia marginata]
MDTHGDPHLRWIPDRCPYPHCPNPTGQGPSGEAGKGGGLLGRGRARRRRSAGPAASTTKIPWYTPYGVNAVNIYIRFSTVSIGNLVDLLVFISYCLCWR